MLARLELAKVLDEISQVVVDMELVRVWIGVLGLTELVDVAGPNLEILLPRY